MKQLTKEHCLWLDSNFALTLKDMPLGICKNDILNYLKGKKDFVFADIYLSGFCNGQQNRNKIDMLGRQLSFVF